MTPLVARVTAALVLLAIALFGAILWTWTGTTATETLRLVAWLAAWASTRRGTP